jgi:hypothetical protein
MSNVSKVKPRVPSNPSTDDAQAPAGPDKPAPTSPPPAHWAPKPGAPGRTPVTPAAGEVDSAAGPRHSPDEPLAQIGTLQVRAHELERATQTLETQLKLIQCMADFAQELGLERRANETPEAFAGRVRAAAKTAGRLAELDDAMESIRNDARADALYLLVAADVLKAELNRRRVPLPRDSSNLDSLRESLRKAVAAALKGPDSSDKVQSAVNDLLNGGVADALWAPQEPAVKKALSGFTDGAQASVKGFLAELYADRYGCLAPERIARELETGGSAAKLVQLVTSTAKLNWTLSDVRAAVDEHPELKVLLPASAADVDPVVSGSAPVTYRMDAHGLVADVGAPQSNPLLEKLRSGALKARWVDNGDGTTSLAFVDAQGQEVGDAEAVQAAADLLHGPLVALSHQIADAWKAGRPPLDEVIRRSGLGRYLGAQPLVTALGTPGLAELLKTQVVANAFSGSSLDKLVAQNHAAGLPAGTSAELVSLQQRLQALNALAPMPFELGLVTQGKSQHLALPLAADAKLSREQRAALGLVQRCLDLVATGTGGKPTPHYGEMDAETVRRLQKIALTDQDPERVQSLDLTPALIRKLLASAAVAMPGQQSSSGEMILRHPVLDRMTDARKVDPVRLAVEYMKEQGYRLPADPPLLDADFYAALDASAAAPLDEAALARAQFSAQKLGPYSAPQRERVLSGSVLIAGDGPKAFVPGSTPTAEDARRLAQRLAPLAEPVSIHTVGPGERHHLPTQEPVVALKLVLAKLDGQPSPVNSDGAIDAFLTGADLRSLRSLCYPDADDSNPAAARWNRVAEAMDRGQVVVANLNDTPGKTDLEKDVNAVLGDLRQMAQAVAMSSIPEDRASAAVDAQLDELGPLKRMPRPLAAAQALLANHFGAQPPAEQAQQGALNADDFARLQKLATQLDAKDKDAASFLEAFRRQSTELAAVVDALRKGRLTLSPNRVQSQPRDAALEGMAARASELFLQGAEVLEAQARAENAGLAGGLYRTGLSAYEHAFSLPGFTDGLVFNSVKDWTVVALKTEMHERGQGADISVSTAMRQASTHVDGPALRALLAEDLGLAAEDKQTLQSAAAALEGRTLSAWDVGSDAEKKAPDGPRAQMRAVDDVVSQVVAIRREAMTHVDGAFLKYLVATHGDLIGRSNVSTLVSGEPSPLPANEDAKKLLLALAEKMPPPWDSLNVTLQDVDPDVRAGKALVQEALSRLNGGAHLWGNLVPGRDLETARKLATRLAGLDATELAPYLKSFCVQQGLASADDLGGIRNPEINAATLDASVLLAKKAVDVWLHGGPNQTPIDPEIGHRMEAAQKTLAAAAAAHRSVSLDGATPEAKALRQLLEATALSFGATGRLDPLDFGAMLAHLPGDLKIRHLAQNEVRDQPSSASLSDIASQMGREIPWTEERARSLRDWTEHVQFDPSRALQTALGTTVMFRHLMHTLVGYDLWVAPLVKSGRALTRWMTGAQSASATSADLGAVARDWLDLQASMISYMTPLPFWMELKGDVEQGKLDAAAGKAVVYVPMMIAAARGMIGLTQAARHLASKTSERFAPRVPFEMAGPVARTEAVPIGESAVETSLLYRGAVHASRALRPVKEAVLDPRKAWSQVFKGARWVGDRLNWRKVRLNVDADFSLTLPPELARWMSEHPDGRVQLTLLRGGKEYRLDVSNRDLSELAQYKDAVPKALLERIGLTGRDAAHLAKSLAAAAKAIPPPAATTAGPIPSLSDLIDPARKDAVTTWQVSIADQTEVAAFRNDLLVKLVKAFYEGNSPAYLKLLRDAGLLDKEHLMRAVMANYRGEMGVPLEATAMPIADVDRILLSPEAYVGQLEAAAGRQGMLLYKATHEGTTYRVIQRDDGRIQVTSGTADVSGSALGKKVLASLEDLKQKYGTTSAAQIAQLKQIETESAQWAARLSGKISPAERAAYKQWAAEVKARFGTTLKEGELSTVLGRARLNLLKARLTAQSLQMELRAGGLSGATASIVRGTATSLKGQLKSPSFYMVLVVAGQQFLVDLGDTVNDDSLSTLQKVEKGIADAALTGGGVIAASAAISLIGKLVPRAGAAISGLGTALLLKQLASGEIADSISKGIMRIQGYKNPLQAMQIWKALGVPEAGYFKIEPDQHPEPSGFGWVLDHVLGAASPEVDDIATLEEDRGDMPTPRLNYWTAYGQMPADDKNKGPNQPIFARIRQLCGLPPDSPQTPIQRPQDVDLDKVKSYVEPVWPTVTLLQRMAELQRKDPILAQVDAVKSFDFAAWEAGVKDATANMISRVELDGTGPMWVVDEGQLRALLLQNDKYGALTEQEQRVLQRKLDAEAQQVLRWSAVLNRLNIPPAQKEAALIELVENMASNHLANSLLFDYVPKKNVQLKGGRSWLYSQLDAPPVDTNIDDYYTLTPYLMNMK